MPIDPTPELVHRIVASQFPQWAELPVVPVDRQGNDNRTFRLGDTLAVRLPSDPAYVAGLEKEDRFLPLLAEHLDMPVPRPVATGAACELFPYPWSVRAWLPGRTPDLDPDLDRHRLAHDLGMFLRQLRAVPAEGGPAAGGHSFHRGAHPRVYQADVSRVLEHPPRSVPLEACRDIWARAARSAWTEPPVWFHGDIAVGNLLTTHGKLSAVIDFGTCGVGDPACDLVIAWTFLTRDERQVLRAVVGLDDATWERAMAWALWKALVTVADPDDPQTDLHGHALTELLADYG